MPHVGLLSFEQIANKYDCAPDDLLQFEALDLLQPLRIGERRFYSKADELRLAVIMRGEALGFSLEELRRLLVQKQEWTRARPAASFSLVSPL